MPVQPTTRPVSRLAIYPGDCRKSCGVRIQPGDTIVPWEGYGWAHQSCPSTVPASTGDTRYFCPRCRVDFTAIHFRAVRQATGQFLRHDCGEIAVYRGPAISTNDPVTVNHDEPQFIQRPSIAREDAAIFGARAERPAPAPAVTVSNVRDGRYTVVLDNGERRTIRLSHGNRTDNEQIQFVSYLSGSNNDSDYTNCGFVRDGQFRWSRRFVENHGNGDGTPLGRCVRALLTADTDQRAQYGMAYALESGNCSRCGRTLTVPASIAMGLGPICADAGY